MFYHVFNDFQTMFLIYCKCSYNVVNVYSVPNGTSGSLMRRLNSVLDLQYIIGHFVDIQRSCFSGFPKVIK